MVSTRGVRYKFSEGERVLCYEPDPTKAKVLYDSKVLEVIESKDKRGRRTVEYLIHFQGWNSSWDRCVSEDFVLKDTEENRQLQRDLAEKSQLQLGAYLYRRERKKGGSAPAGAGPAKRARHGFSDDGSSSSTPPDEGAETAVDTDSSVGSGSSSQAPTPPPHSHIGRAQINLPPALRDRLTFDYHLVVKRGRVSSLPASPSAAEVLESFVKWFARSGAWRPARRHEPPRPDQRPDFRDVCCRLNLVREVADGLRVYFDFILRGHLLYKQELNQYHEMCGKHVQIPSPSPPLQSPREYAHLPPDPDDVLDKGPQSNEQPSAVEKSDSDEKPPDKSDDPAASNKKDSRCVARSGVVARRLRSHKSCASSASPDEPPVDVLSSSVCSSESSVSSGWRAPPAPAPAPAPPHGRTPLSLLLDKVAKWQIIPREGTEHLPSRVYGAIHLARLFVKLPDFLNCTQMPDMKLKLILKHIDMFVQYLDEHNEWFGEMHYVTDGGQRTR